MYLFIFKFSSAFFIVFTYIFSLSMVVHDTALHNITNVKG